MAIKHLYIVHHSHTDIGYTDLQERIIFAQVQYIRNAIALGRELPQFRWNCETYYCVEQFLKAATPEEKESFFAMVRSGNIGISANYLNFNDLADSQVLRQRTQEMKELFAQQGIPVKTAMIADINGISMGTRDAMLNSGVEFLYTNIHTHHGMYPLYQNQNAYFWENDQGQRLLVWNGEHYNLGNALGLVPNKNTNFMTQTYFGQGKGEVPPVDAFHDRLTAYVEEVLEAGYAYDFLISSVSGVFSDNAPPNPAILQMVEAFNEKYGQELTLEMVTLQGLYEKIRPALTDVPVYRGDLNDWWANGIGSTPYLVKHYLEARRMYRLCQRLEEKTGTENPQLKREAQDNLLLYAEHTCGHSSTVTDPYTTMVQNLDIRKNSYASKAHEASALRLNGLTRELGDTLTYYGKSGQVKVINPTDLAGEKPVEFYVECWKMDGVRVWQEGKPEALTVQLSRHPRGVQINFVDTFDAREEKVYCYQEISQEDTGVNTRHAYVGAERVRDIVNDYDPETYRLPYGLENPWMKISYQVGQGITQLIRKSDGRNLILEGDCRLFTPIYENTQLNHGAYEERRLLGRNIRGLHATKSVGRLTDVQVLDHGPVFDRVELEYQMEGCVHASVILKLFRQLPKLDVTFRLGKTISQDIESVYLPLGLNLPEAELWIDKGDGAMRPGIDQIPGTNMEYYATSHGAAYVSQQGSVLLRTLDVPLLTMGQLRHHPVQLCDGKAENNRRPLYSWVMNNTWETNFKMDLSGFGEFCYSLELSDCTDGKAACQALGEGDLGMCSFIVG